MVGNIVFGCVLVFSFFSTQNQVPKIIIGISGVTYHFEALSVMILNFQKVDPVLRKAGLRLLILSINSSE